MLECANVIAVRYKEGLVKGDFTKDIELLFNYNNNSSVNEISLALIKETALIKRKHAASMIDCFLLAYANESRAGIITCDPEILNYNKKEQKRQKVSGSFSLVEWFR